RPVSPLVLHLLRTPSHRASPPQIPQSLTLAAPTASSASPSSSSASGMRDAAEDDSDSPPSQMSEDDPGGGGDRWEPDLRGGNGGRWAPFPDQVLENVLESVLQFLTAARYRNAASLVCRSWYRAEAQMRRELFIGNYYAVAQRRAVERFGGHGGRAAGRSAPGSPARAVAPCVAAVRHGAGVRAVGVRGPALQVPGRVVAGGEAAAVGRPDQGGAARRRLP
ncbi:unnamed protein product, partial [Urochloa humidicola]